MADNNNYMRQMENLLNQIHQQNMRIESMPVMVSRRTSVPSFQQITSSTIRNTYPLLSYNVTGRPYVGGFRSIYSPERLYERSMPPLLNFSGIAASEHNGPILNSIEAIMNAINSLTVLVLSLYNVIQMGFTLFLACSDGILQLRLLMIKLGSSVKSIKVVQWFLTKVIYLLNIIKRGNGSNTEDVSNENNLRMALIGTQDIEIHSVEESCPLFVFAGLPTVTPYLMHKIMGTTTSISDSGSINEFNRFYNGYNGFQNVGNAYYNREVLRRWLKILRPRYSRYITMGTDSIMNSMVREDLREDGWPTNSNDLEMVVRPLCEWNCTDPRSISLVVGEKYFTTKGILLSARQTGWLYVYTLNGLHGYVPINHMILYKADNILTMELQTVRLPNSDASDDPPYYYADCFIDE